MKAYFKFNDEPGEVEGNPRCCVANMERLAHEGVFEPDRLFANGAEMAELEKLDDTTDILGGFDHYRDDSITPTLFSENDIVRLVTHCYGKPIESFRV